MSADPQSPKVVEREVAVCAICELRFTGRACEGSIRLRRDVEQSDALYEDVLAALEDAGVSHVGPADDRGLLPHLSAADRVGVLAADRASLQEENGRLREAARVVADDSYKSKCAYERAQGEVVRLQARVEACEAALWRCVELTGEDTSDGRPTWPDLTDYAVREVERLRQESDESYDADIDRARADGARQERERIRARLEVLPEWDPTEIAAVLSEEAR